MPRQKACQDSSHRHIVRPPNRPTAISAGSARQPPSPDGGSALTAIVLCPPPVLDNLDANYAQPQVGDAFAATSLSPSDKEDAPGDPFAAPAVPTETRIRRSGGMGIPSRAG